MGRRGVCFVVVLVGVAACGGGGGSDESISTTAPSVSAVVTSTTIGAPITAASAASCSGTEVDLASLVALDATDGRFCWSAVSNWNVNAFAVADGRVLFTGNPCDQGGRFALRALDAATGAALWTLTLPADTELPAPLSGSPRSLSTDGQVVVTPFGPATAGVDLASGQVLWTVDGVTPLAGGPDFVVGVVGGPESQAMVALDRRTGAERWRTEMQGQFVGGVAADATAVLVGVGQTTVAYDAATGAKRWEAPFGQASDTYAVRVVDGVATGVTGVEPDPSATRAFDVATGQPLWTNPAPPVQSPEPTDGNIYVRLSDSAVGALDPQTGELRWKVDIPGNGGGILAGPGLVLAPAEAERLNGLDPGTGEVRWTIGVDDARLPIEGATTPNGSVSSVGVLPTSAGVFVSYGNCLGN